MNFKDNPNYVTTKEVSDALRCGRTNVQKLEALGKLPRAGVEGNRVYYSRHDMDALADDKIYGAAHSAKKTNELPPPYYADGYSPDTEYRRWERAMMQRYEAQRQPMQPDATAGVQRQLERIGNEIADHAREQREWRQTAQERTAAGGVNWTLLLGTGAVGLLAWALIVEARKRQEIAQAERDREFQLKFKLLLRKASDEELDEYTALHWKSTHPDDGTWESQFPWTRREFTLKVKVSMGIATEAEKEQYRSTWRNPMRWSFVGTTAETGAATDEGPPRSP